MKNFKRFAALVLVLTLMLAAFSACSKPQEEEKPDFLAVAFLYASTSDQFLILGFNSSTSVLSGATTINVIP